MLSKNQKRFILIIIDILFSAYIYYFNTYILGNYDTILKISLSITTFLIVFTPFEIYWSFRDIWFDRWIPLDFKDISKNNVQIEVNDGYLHADLIKPKDQEKIKKKNTVIIVSHGFSDTKETLQYYCFPMAQQGYVVLAYDARGIGESKKTGKRSQFLARIDDFNKILDWIKEDENMKNMKIFCAGFSVGALTVLCGGFENREIEKIIGISSMSNYRQNLPKFNLLVLFSYFIKGVKLFPKEEENKKISPYILFSRLKNTMSEEEWNKFSKRVMLIHCKNDRVIKFKNFRENRLILESSPENMLILKKGGHSQKKNELALVGATLNFFKS
jgi:predicted esterase